MDETEVEATQCDESVETGNKKSRPRKQFLYSKIVKQMEFYFGDANLSHDRFLSQLMEVDKYVPLETFMTFNKIRSMTTDINDLVKALRNSEMLKVTDDGTKVYRVTEFKEKKNVEDCSIYVEQLPPDASHEWVSGIFSAYGQVDYVSIPKYRKRQAIKGFAFVEYASPESAEKALEAFGSAGCCLPSQMPPEELCSIVTFEEEQEDGGNPSERAAETKTETSDGEGHKQKKRKKRESEGGGMDSAEERGGRETNGSTEKKRKKKQPELVEDNQLDEPEEIAEKQSQPTTKKKKKKHSLEPEEQAQEEVEKAKKKKKHDSDEGEDEEYADSQVQRHERSEKRAAEGPAGERGEEGPSKRRRKGPEAEAVPSEDAEAEDLERGSDSDRPQGQGGGEAPSKKKRNRKRNRNKSKKGDKKEEGPLNLGLRILSKCEWRRLRNKYLNMQREQMHILKQHLARAQWGACGDSGPAVEALPQPPGLAFTPGVIVRVSLAEPLTDLGAFKGEARVLPDVRYVDMQEGASEAFLRCGSAEGAQKLVEALHWDDMSVLTGKTEIAYWEKIKRDREEKRSQKRPAEKQRGRDKLLKRAERELGKHIRFDDC